MADKGIDYTVIYSGYQKDDKYEIAEDYSEPISDNIKIARRIINKIINWVGRKDQCYVNIDCIGVGTGVVSAVREFVFENNYDNVHVSACHYGEGAHDKKRFHNKKAENYFRNADIMAEGLIKIPNDRKIIKELNSMKWEFSSTNKIKMLDPDKSPDFADALVYFTWRPEGEVLVADGGEDVFG